MKQGHKIYYLKNNGNVVTITSEISGWGQPTTIDEDFGNYSKLKEYDKESIGVIELEYGELSRLLRDNNAISFSVDVSGDEPKLKFETFEPAEDTEPAPPIKSLDEIIDEKVSEVKNELSTALAEVIENSEKNKVELSTAIADIVDMIANQEG